MVSILTLRPTIEQSSLNNAARLFHNICLNKSHTRVIFTYFKKSDAIKRYNERRVGRMRSILDQAFLDTK